jgi:hypothetical protein
MSAPSHPCPLQRWYGEWELAFAKAQGATEGHVESPVTPGWHSPRLSSDGGDETSGPVGVGQVSSLQVAMETDAFRLSCIHSHPICQFPFQNS